MRKGNEHHKCGEGELPNVLQTTLDHYKPYFFILSRLVSQLPKMDMCTSKKMDTTVKHFVIIGLFDIEYKQQ